MEMKEINELATALAKAQGEIKGAKADSTNPHFKSNYADLASVWDAIREPLSKNGLSVVQLMESHEKQLYVKTILLHSSGQSISSLIPVLAKDQTPQSMGSALSYSRRYSLAAMCGVFQVDDDANAAQPPPKVPPQVYQEPESEFPPYELFPEDKPHKEASKHVSGPTAAQYRLIAVLMNKAGWSDEDMKKYILNNFGHDSSKKMRFDQVNLLIEVLKTAPPLEQALSGKALF